MLVYLGTGREPFRGPAPVLHRDRSRGPHRRRPHRQRRARPHRGERRLERPEHLHRGRPGSRLDARAGPRLRVGDEPVSTTVADVNGDGIPDIICVDQGSDNVVVLRGVGGGFFDDSDPLILPDRPEPDPRLRRQVRRRPGPGPRRARLRVEQPDLLLEFRQWHVDPEFIPTGGLDPVAGVMGAYLNNGYDDLFIAHNGDSRITVLEGGPGGLTPGGSLDVGPSVQPTDLAVSTDESGDLQIYVAARGLDQAILLHFTPGDGTANVGPSAGSPLPPPAPTQGGEPGVPPPDPHRPLPARGSDDGRRRTGPGLDAGGDGGGRAGRRVGAGGGRDDRDRRDPPADHLPVHRPAGVPGQQPGPTGPGPGLGPHAAGPQRPRCGRRPDRGIGYLRRGRDRRRRRTARGGRRPHRVRALLVRWLDGDRAIPARRLEPRAVPPGPRWRVGPAAARHPRRRRPAGPGASRVGLGTGGHGDDGRRRPARAEAPGRHPRPPTRAGHRPGSGPRAG